MSVQDTIQAVLDLDRQLKEKKATTISDLLKQRGEIDQALKALGHDGTTKPTTKKEPKRDGNKYCKICQIYGHDGRFHRRKDTAPPKAEKPEKLEKPPALPKPQPAAK